MSALPPTLATLPLVGRAAELSLIRSTLDGAEASRGTTLLFSGEAGIGKTRLTEVARDEAKRRGWGVVGGRAYPVETGVPYALFADALLPALRALSPESRATFTRGVDEELARLFPSIAPAERRPARPAVDDPGDFKNRLLWNFTQLLKRFTTEMPLLVVLEDLQWADASTLELLHFVARHARNDRLVFLGTYKSDDREANVVLHATEHSLVTNAGAHVHTVGALSRQETAELVRLVFGTAPAHVGEFPSLLYGWTRGNPFFIEETLKTLVLSGRLRQEAGTWLGWEVDAFELPASVRDAVLRRIDRLSAGGRSIAELAAVIGTRVGFDTLAAVAELNEADLLEAIGELVRQQILVETIEEGELSYDFVHPIIRETAYSRSGLTRSRLLHGRVAQALEIHYGAAAHAHSDELAFHYSRAHSRSLVARAAHYLAAAGRAALAKYANREAAGYLAAALDCSEQGVRLEGEDTGGLIIDLARARQRLGDYDGAMALWERARRLAGDADDLARVAAVERRMGLACFWTGRPAEALRHYEAGLAAGERSGSTALRVRIALAKGMCLQELGRPAEAKGVAQDALRLAQSEGPELMARVHRTLLQLLVWTGPTDEARAHGSHALRIADASHDLSLAFSAHWAMAVLEGALSGNSAGLVEHVTEASRIADALNSPVLRAWTAELEIEFASGKGDWDSGIALGERAIAIARALNQWILIPRLLVWTGLLYLARAEIERGKRYIDEAWTLSGAGVSDRPPNVHIVLPAHIGRAGYHLAIGDYQEAIRIGEAGLEIADRSGYVVWTIHRLLPIIAESSLWLRDLDRARRLGARLRQDSERLGHRLGLAWADACDALVVWLGGDPAGGAVLLRGAAEKLEAVPFVFDGARVRRQLAGRLAEIGDREGALQELRYVHDVLARLGAERELERTRAQFRELGARPPARPAGPGGAGLSGREIQIAQLVAKRKSNKSISRTLGISTRTVSTHLSNIFRKLEIASRGELADYLRDHELAD